MSTNLIECSRHGASGVTKGYDIDNSLRFNDDDSAYLSWTPTTAGNRKTWTWSGWVKRGNLNISTVLFSAGAGASVGIEHELEFFFSSYNNLETMAIGSANVATSKSTRQFRDLSAWYHCVCVFDTTQASAADRIKIYANNNLLTLSNLSTLVPTQNADGAVNGIQEHRIGSRVKNSNQHLDGHLAEVNFIDGQALTPSDFGESGDYGEWKPVEYKGTYGNNGFYLNFKGGGIIAATGGTITTDGDYKVHTFTADGTFTPTAGGFVEYLVIGGGGGSGLANTGSPRAGGGGAGGYRTGGLDVTGQSYSITVGNGGTGSTNSQIAPNHSGDDSVFSTITAAGGGGGANGSVDNTAYCTGQNGGSGGGGGAYAFNSGGGSGGTATSGQGNAGGTGYHNSGVWASGGGGGGAGGAGTNGVSGTGGNGGAGLASSITGSSVTRAGGGASASHTNNSGSSSGGGGVAGANGAANTGGGAGAANSSQTSGNDGGKGVVIIRYQFQ